MAKIRDDLSGVVWAHVKGESVMLKAGDEIPDGAVVAEGLVAPAPRKAGGARGGARKPN